MRWFLGTVATLLLVLAVGALVAPRLIEWNDYRGRIADAFAQRTGLQAEIGGDLHMVLLPRPTLFAADVRLSAPGDPAGPLATVPALRAELDPLSLAAGNVEPRTIALEAPDIRLRLGERGLADATALSERLLAVGESRLQNLAVADARLTVVQDGRPLATFAGIDLAFAAPGAERPGSLQLEGRWDEVPFNATLEVGALPASGQTTLRGRGELAGGLAQISYGGALTIVPEAAAPRSGGAADLSTEGQLNATVRDPAALLSLLWPQDEDGRQIPHEPLTLAARLIAEPGSLVVNNLDLRWGRTTIGGAAAAIVGPPVDLNLTLQVAGLDLDLLAPVAARLLPAVDGTLSLPASDRITFDIAATALRYRQSVVRRLQVAGVLEQGVLDLQELQADLPGSATLAAGGRLLTPGELPEFNGHLVVESADARRTLGWLGVDEALLPAAAPRRLRAEADLALDAGLWRVLDLAVEMDGTSLQGGIALRPAGRPSFSANLRLGHLHLDPWMPVLGHVLSQAADRGTAGAAAASRAVGERLADLAGLLAGVDSNLRLSLRDIAWQDSQLSEGNLDLTLVRGELSLTRAVGVLGDGLRTELSGAAAVAEDGGGLDYDLKVEAAGQNLFDQLQRLVPVLLPGAGTVPAPGAADEAAAAPGQAVPPAGPSRLALRLGGDARQALLRDLVFDLPGARLTGRGTLGLTAPVPTLVADIAWQVRDPRRFASRFANRLGGGDLLLYRQPSSGAATLTVDAGTLGISGLILELPALTATAEGRLNRTGTPRDFDLRIGLQADSPGALLDAAGLPVGESAGSGIAAAGPVSLIAHVNGTPAELQLQEARLTYGAAVLQLDGTGSLQPAPGLAGRLSLSAPELAPLLAGTGLTARAGADGRPLGHVAIAADYRLTDSALQIEGLKGRAGPTEVDAALALEWAGAAPVLLLDIGLAGLPLDRLQPGRPAALFAGILAGQAESAHRGRAPYAAGADLAEAAGRLRDRLRLDLALSATAISAGDGLFEDGRLELQVREQELTLEVLEGRLAGGRIAATGRVDARGLPALSLQAEVEAVDAAALVDRLTGLQGITGRTDGRLRLRTAGTTADAMLDRLSGQVDVTMTDGRMAGIDIAAIAAMLDRTPPEVPPPGALAAALGVPDADAAGGPAPAPDDRATAFETLSGQLFLESGVLRLQHVAAALAEGIASWHGSVDLPAERLDLTGTFRLAAWPEAPAIELEMEGPFADLQRRALTDAMRQYLAGRAAAARISAPVREPMPAEAAPPDESPADPPSPPQPQSAAPGAASGGDEAAADASVPPAGPSEDVGPGGTAGTDEAAPGNGMPEEAAPSSSGTPAPAPTPAPTPAAPSDS
ncbi:AsmA family protein [Marinibaculum pumilum]|uniref:AsmA family protein n=1 Tax=Marinibaculum pumilum TaxID=1766165 RepID=A0ABV7KZI8_9PROT